MFYNGVKGCDQFKYNEKLKNIFERDFQILNNVFVSYLDNIDFKLKLSFQNILNNKHYKDIL